MVLGYLFIINKKCIKMSLRDIYFNQMDQNFNDNFNIFIDRSKKKFENFKREMLYDSKFTNDQLKEFNQFFKIFVDSLNTVYLADDPTNEYDQKSSYYTD